MAYFRRLHFLLILEKVLIFISDELDVSRIVSRYDNIRACIAPYNSKRQFGYSMGTEIQEVLGAVEEMKWTERCDAPPCAAAKAVLCNGKRQRNRKASSSRVAGASYMWPRSWRRAPQLPLGDV